jgi:uncharacterized metal-binding protein
MASKVNRRRFLRAAGTGIASGAAAAAAISAQAADNPPLLPPLDEKATQSKPAGKTEPQPVCCAPAAKLIFACSGAADVGKIADLAARKLTADGAGKMFCLAGIGGRVSGIMETTRAAKILLAIDGCPLHCARNTLEQAGFKKFEHVCLSDLGMEKGKTPATDEAVAKVVQRAKGRLAG